MYVRVDEGFLEHPKTKRFCRLIDNPDGHTNLLRLWTWALNCAPDGDISDAEPEDIEDAIRWRGSPGRCYQAMVTAGFIDELDGRRTIHNWDLWVGADLEKMDKVSEARRESARLRKQAQRDREREAASGVHLVDNATAPTSAPPVTQVSHVTKRDGHAPENVTVTPVTLPDQSRQGQARQVQRERETAPAGQLQPVELRSLFALARSQCLPNTLEWDYPAGNSLQKAEDFLGRHGNNPKAMELVRPSMELFFRQVAKATGEEGAKLRKSTFGFAAWASDFGSLCQRLMSPASDPEQAQDVHCSDHREGRNSGKKARKENFRKSCPECRHLDVRGSPRPAGEASSMGDVLSGFQPRG